MSLSASLAKTLSQIRKTASVREDQTRMLDSSTASERLTAITKEIGETLLPRILIFQIGDIFTLTIDAGSRRLLKVLDIQPSSLLKDGDALFSGRDDSLREEQLASLSHMLTLFISYDAPLRVLSLPPQELYGADEVGYTAEELEKAFKKLDLSEEFIEAELKKALDLIQAKFKADSASEHAESSQSASAAADLPDTVPDNVATFFTSIQKISSVTFLIDQSSHVIESVFTDNAIDLSGITSEIMQMISRWDSEVSQILVDQKLIVMRSQAADGASVSFFTASGFVVVAAFKNKDLGRAFSVWEHISGMTQ